jgi:hypothetical protein
MNWRSNKKFSVALLQANVNLQKNGLTVKKKSKKKCKKNENPNIQKSKKNQKKNLKRNLCEIIAIIKDTKKNVRY